LAHFSFLKYAYKSSRMKAQCDFETPTQQARVRIIIIKNYYYCYYYYHNLRMHTEEKPYSCKVCDKSFPNSSTLTAYHRTHTKNRIIAARKKCVWKVFHPRWWSNETHKDEAPHQELSFFTDALIGTQIINSSYL